MAIRRPLLIAGICASLSLAACGDSDEEPAAGEAETPVAEADRGAKPRDAGGEPGITISAGASPFGEILFDGEDQAIYLFDKESSEASECYGACAEAWPPVLTEGDPEADGAVEAKLVGTTERDDGSTQVTYAGQPLYYYVDDPPGEVLCQNVEEFGGLWLVVEPGGDPVL